jgi:phage terminase Nu1 subunit (DNA packaging protein)
MIKTNEISKVSRAVVSAVFKNHPSSVNKWVQRGCPRNADNKTYDLAAVVQWRIEELALTEGKIDNEEAIKWLTAFRRERALLAKLEREKAEENLLPKDAVMDIWISRIHMVKNGLLSWSGRLSGLLEHQDQKEIAQIIDREVNDLLNQFAENSRYTPRPEKEK